MMKRKSSLIDWTIYNQNKVKEKNSNRQFSFMKTKTGNLSQIKNKQIIYTMKSLILAQDER